MYDGHKEDSTFTNSQFRRSSQSRTTHERYRTPTNMPSCEQSLFLNAIIEHFRKSWKALKQIFAKRLPLRIVNETSCSRKKKSSRHCNITLTLWSTCLEVSLRMRCPTVWARSKVNAFIRSCK